MARHADRHRALVVPDEVIPNLKSAIEKIVPEAATEEPFDIYKLE